MSEEEQKHLMQSYYDLHEKYYKLQQENRQLKAELELYKDNDEYLNNKIDKAIEHCKSNMFVDSQFIYELLEILGDKEIEEIPQFKGTLEQLNNLSIIGDKE